MTPPLIMKTVFLGSCKQYCAVLLHRVAWTTRRINEEGRTLCRVGTTSSSGRQSVIHFYPSSQSRTI